MITTQNQRADYKYSSHLKGNCLLQLLDQEKFNILKT